uniref:Zinc fingers and homeoboxes protein 1 n=1 Tax=Apteryx owenii TaxID=8824 RepID=A0A8B9PIW1_APTOW
AEAMELPLGCEFEDSVFAQSKERGPGGGGGGPPYCAKRCEPRWFCKETDSVDDTEILTAGKFLGDLAYREQEFEKALCEYSSCLLLLPASNIAMRRDVQEGQARCLSRLGRHKEALDIAEKLRNGATNTDHLTTVLNLQFAIYQGLENVEKKIMCLQQLICLHPFNPWYWKLLAEAYMSLLQDLSPLFFPEVKLNQSEEVGVSDSNFKTSTGREINFQSHSSESQKECFWSSLAIETKNRNPVTCSNSQIIKEFLCTSEEAERRDEGKHTASASWERNMLKKVGIKACASFIRARLLLQLTQLQQSSFVLEKNIKSQKEIEDKVKRFGLKESSLLLMTKVMGVDLLPEKIKEEFQGEVKCIGPSALSSLVTASATEFEIKCNLKVLLYLFSYLQVMME